jgi:hypothetical protein
MKLQLLAMAVSSLVPNHGGELLSPSLPNSVSQLKKTSLQGWLPLPHAQLPSPATSFSCRGRTFTPVSSPQVDYSNSK